MSYRGPPGENMRSMGDDRMMGGMEGEKMPRDEMDDHGRGPRPPYRGRRQSPGREKPFGDRPRDYYGRDEMGPGRDRSPIRGGGGGGGGYDDRYPERFKRDEPPYPRRDEMGRKDMGRPYMEEPYHDKHMGGMDGRGRYDLPPGGMGSRFDHPEEFKPRSFGYPNVPPYKGYYKPEMMKPNECEIIVINKQQRAYAESIEARIKNLGIQVDMLFLKDEALLVQTIDDIARRGSLYAMVVSPLNETHGSVTLNILYGTPQEHRNMPLDDALKLVARNFHDYMRSQRELMDRDRLERGFYAGSFPADREIQFLLRLLADGRQVSIGELETVIKYLTERRDRMKSTQGDRGPGPHGQGMPPDMGGGGAQPAKIKDDIDMVQKEQDLQNRIMNIMNQGLPPAEAGAGPPGANKPPMPMGIPGIGDVQGPRPNQPQMGPGMGNAAPGAPRPNMMPNRGGVGMGAGPPVSQAAGQNQMAMPGSKPPGMGPNQPGLAPNQSSMVSQPSSSLAATTSQPVSSTPSPYINFDNPSVKKALDSLMQSGPNLLKTISMTSTSTASSQDMSQQAPGNKMPSGAGGAGNMGVQRGPGGMGDMANVGMSQASNMPHMQGMGAHPQGGGNMGPPQNRNVVPQQGGNMGPPQHGVGGRPGQNMAPGSMPNMGNRPGSYPGPQGYGGGGGSNMMGNRPPFMGGGPGGNQGMGGGGGGGGGRRF